MIATTFLRRTRTDKEIALRPSDCAILEATAVRCELCSPSMIRSLRPSDCAVLEATAVRCELCSPGMIRSPLTNAFVSPSKPSLRRGVTENDRYFPTSLLVSNRSFKPMEPGMRLPGALGLCEGKNDAVVFWRTEEQPKIFYIEYLTSNKQLDLSRSSKN